LAKEKRKGYDTEVQKETCVLVGVVTQTQTTELLDEYLDELEFLAETAEAVTVKRFTQKLAYPDPKTFLGSGKILDVVEYVKKNKADMVVFDDELSPSQIRNIEKLFNPTEFEEHQVKILDRNNLILDIFARRARTAHAKTQVELAQYKYLLPRLTGMWTHLQKQKGGIGMKGPGETEIETDRRVIREKITLLQKQLKQIDKQKQTQRGNRGAMVRVALVGYTNVGKSTIMNMLSKSKVFAENKLFATLDTTVRKVVVQNLPFLLSDTVGFIRKLPHHLVESFKSTLDETREADILMHVLDISHPNFEDQYNVVNETLSDIEVHDKPTIVVFNKIDAFTYIKKDEDDLTPKTRENYSLEELKETWMANIGEKEAVFISAHTKENLEGFRSILYDKVKAVHEVRYPFNNYLY